MIRRMILKRHNEIGLHQIYSLEVGFIPVGAFLSNAELKS
jgi:hypothetical protein